MASRVHTLYVVLQGEFVISRKRSGNSDDDILQIAAPQIDCHSYKAGPWLSDWKNLDELPSTRLYLQNAFGDRKQGSSFDTKCHHPRSIPEKNPDLLMSCGPEAPNGYSPRVNIIAPVPLAILSGLAESAGGVAIIITPPNGHAMARVAPSHPAAITILLYKFYDDLPYLADENGSHIADIGGPSDDLQSLNIYASSEEDDEDPEHAKAAFAAAAELLGEKASLMFEDGTLFQNIPATPPAGLTWAQINLFLSEVIKLYGDPILEADFVDLQDLHLPFNGPNFTVGPSTNCGVITGDDDGVN